MQLALVEQAGKAQAQLLIMVAPSVEKLIRASAGQARCREIGVLGSYFRAFDLRFPLRRLRLKAFDRKCAKEAERSQ